VGHPVFGTSGEVIEVVGTHVDITERKRIGEEPERLRRLEADVVHMKTGWPCLVSWPVLLFMKSGTPLTCAPSLHQNCRTSSPIVCNCNKS
jgi:hypothetical protein